VKPWLHNTRGYGAVGCRPLGLGVAELSTASRTLDPPDRGLAPAAPPRGAQLSYDLVALPADACTREQLDWVAAAVAEAGGTAGVWLGRPASLAQERDLAAAMAAARATEYQSLHDQAQTAAGLPPAERARVARRLRDQLRRIGRRDFFPPPQRAAAAAAVNALVAVDPTCQAAGPVRGHAGSRQ